MRFAASLLMVATVGLATPAWAEPETPPSQAASPAPPAPPIAAPPAVPRPPSVYIPAPPPQLNGAVVYVYSFLDVRSDGLGGPCIDLVHEYLVEALKTRGASARVLAFKDSPLGVGFVPETGPGAYTSYRMQETTTPVPVRGVIAGNAADEQAAAARYRLIIFPKSFTVSGAWQFWDIDWDLVDTATGRSVWTTTTSGRRMVWMRINEGSKPRAEGIVEALMTDLNAEIPR